MRYKDLERFASQCQIDRDKATRQMVEQYDLFTTLSKVQSICDFNLAGVFNISPVIIHRETLDFLSKNIEHFNRKLSVLEMFNIDGVISFTHPKTFKEFKDFYKQTPTTTLKERWKKLKNK